MASGHQRPPNPEARPPTTPITVTIPFGDPREGPKRCAGTVLPAPETVGTRTDYEIRTQLAVGGMGIVYWAWDHHLHRDVAVKLLRSEHRFEKDLIGRFVNESQIMCRLQHPGIPPVYDSGFCADGRPYYAMKLVKGITLTELNRRRGWGNADILAIFVQVCHALDYAHCQGVAHLDVKPSNIMVGAFGEVYLMDWGLARFRGNEAAVGAFTRRAALSSDDRADAGSLGEFDSIRGTPAYMPPEQAKGERVDARADIFGLGAILCELLTGLPPYEGDSTRQVFGQATKAKTEAAFRRLDGAAVDPRLVRLTKRCLAASPGERPRSAGDVAKELHQRQVETPRIHNSCPEEPSTTHFQEVGISDPAERKLLDSG